MQLLDLDQKASSVRDALRLIPHSEGGHYREVWRDAPVSGDRGVATSILFLLAEGERSHWHRVDAAEIWLWQGGAPLSLNVVDAHTRHAVMLGPDPAGGEVLQFTVAAHAWQEARSLGAWTLVSCVVAPAFTFAGFELAPADWSPDR